VISSPTTSKLNVSNRNLPNSSSYDGKKIGLMQAPVLAQQRKRLSRYDWSKSGAKKPGIPKI
jgi:hypothetical protein